MKKLLSTLFVFTMVCTRTYESLTHGILRCENKEAVCYIYYGGNRGGMDCKFKGGY